MDMGTNGSTTPEAPIRANLRVEFNRDAESGNWYFAVPALGIVGGGCATEDEMRRHALEAIEVALSDDDGAEAPGVTHLAVTVSAA